MKIKNYIRNFILVLGIGLCAYPLIAGLIEKNNQSKVVSTYENEVRQQEKECLTKMIKNAKEYNRALFEAQKSGVTSKKKEILSKEHYEKLLNFSNEGIMAVIEIPKIDVNLPIYHGTDDDVLSVGVGHLEGTSLPVGDTNNHCVLTGHRGLPNAKLFTRLDELEQGDLFFIKVGRKVLAYSVCKIYVISPENVNGMAIKEGNDIVSLVTCTPYGINSHRLVVMGKRTEYKETEYRSIKPQIASKREIIFSLLPLVMIGIVLMKVAIERRENKCAICK